MWNMALIVLTFSLTILGTFVTRSGIIESVHAFASTNVGVVFLSFLAIVIATSVGLIWWRSDLLTTENRLESFVSRESAFLFNNLLLLGIAFAIWWGTFFPILSEAFTGQRISVGPPFFNQVNGPLSLALLLTLGVGPVIAWRRASRHNLERNFRLPLIVLLAAGVVAVTLGLRAWYAVAVVAFSAFVAATVVQEMWRGTRARMRSKGSGAAAALVGLVSRNRRRYGGYIVHIGVLFVFAGIAGSMFQVEQKARLSPGDEIAIGRYRVEYRGGDIEQGPNYTATVANLTVTEDGGTPYRVRPERRFYPTGQEQTTSEVAIWSRLFEDFYAILETFDPATGQSDITLIVNPLLLWIWIGGGVMVFGTLIALTTPRPAATRRPASDAREAAEGAPAVSA
jgi:cytochrome c-type biogenesis protein CcmF